MSGKWPPRSFRAVCRCTAESVSPGNTTCTCTCGELRCTGPCSAHPKSTICACTSGRRQESKPRGLLVDVHLWLKPEDSKPSHYLCGRRARLRFTVRRPASAEVSPCCHRPSGGDVACSVHVGVARTRVTDLALENRLALAVLGCDVPACGASLRRVRGRDLLDPTVSLVLQTRGEHTPTACADGPV